MISIWEKETFFAPQDVVIVGSGLVGLWSAFYLKKKHPELKVTIIDRGLIPTGASTRNAGFACFGSLSELVHDIKKMGADDMLDLVEMRYRGLRRIQKYFDADAIDFELCGGFELYDISNTITKEQLDENIEYVNKLLRPITDSKKTFKRIDEKVKEYQFTNTKHLVRNNLEGYLHPGKLIKGLLRLVQSMDVQIFNGIEVKNYDLLEENVELATNRSLTFTAKHLLICTNAFANELLPEIEITPARGQILLTSPIKHLPWKGTFHSEEGYYYFRNLGNKVLLGGARNKAFQEEQTVEMQTSEFIQEELKNYLDKVVLPNFRGQYTIEHRWSGIMGMGEQKGPIIKQVLPNVFCAVRMSGMGVALSPVVGQKVAALMYE